MDAELASLKSSLEASLQFVTKLCRPLPSTPGEAGEPGSESNGKSGDKLDDARPEAVPRSFGSIRMLHPLSLLSSAKSIKTQSHTKLPFFVCHDLKYLTSSSLVGGGVSVELIEGVHWLKIATAGIYRITLAVTLRGVPTGFNSYTFTGDLAICGIAINRNSDLIMAHYLQTYANTDKYNDVYTLSCHGQGYVELKAGDRITIAAEPSETIKEIFNKHRETSQDIVFQFKCLSYEMSVERM